MSAARQRPPSRATSCCTRPRLCLYRSCSCSSVGYCARESHARAKVCGSQVSSPASATEFRAQVHAALRHLVENWTGRTSVLQRTRGAGDARSGLALGARIRRGRRALSPQGAV
eukprot:scaffold11_cov257-Pinguiococcus_pyrenoidosus.AAC.9